MSKLERRTFAQELTTLELPLVTVSFLRHIRVFDFLAVAPYTTLDGDIVDGREPRGQYAELGGFVIEARATADWDAILDLLVELESTQPEYFHRLMRKCVALSSGPREADGFHELLDDHDQAIFDVAAAREAQREEQGYVSTGDARAFLESARRTPLACAAPQRQGLVRSSAGSRLELVRAFLEQHPNSEGELAQLANTLVSGCSIQGRAFEPREARNGALAICNLGLEHGPHGSLMTAFRSGFAVLHQRVCMRTARRLAGVIGAMDCGDRDIQFELRVLKRELLRAIEEGRPWKARNSLEVIVMLDAPSWAALAALVDECPVMHAAIGASGNRQPIAATDYEFIASSVQLPRIDSFLDALPETLLG